MLNSINIDKFKVLHALEKSNSLLLAANSLHVTPSAVSQSLKSLEASIGQQLFVRSGKRYFATEACKQILKVYQPFSEQMKAKLEEITSGNEVVAGKLRVFSPINFGREILSEYLNGFLKRHRNSQINAELGTPIDGLIKLVNNETDFTFFYDEDLLKKNDKIRSRRLYRGKMVLVCSRSFSDEKISGKHGLSHLKNLNHIASNESQDALNLFYQKVFKAKTNLVNNLVVYDLNMILQAVRNNLGLALAPLYSVKQEIDSGDLVQISRSISHSIYICWLRDKKLTNIERTFLEYVTMQIPRKMKG